MATITLPDLSGKKTYIIAIIGIAFTWIDYKYGLGLSDTCKAAIVTNPEAPCAITLSQAIQISLGFLAAMGLRSGVTTESTKAA